MTHTFNLDKGTIRLIVSHQGKKYRRSTGLSIDPSLWNKKAKSLPAKCRDVRVWEKLRLIHALLCEKEVYAKTEGDVLRAIEYALSYGESGEKEETTPTFSEYLCDWVSRGGSSIRQRKLFADNIARFFGTNLDWKDIDETFYFLFKNKMDAAGFAINYKQREVSQLKSVMEEGRKLKYHTNLAYKDWGLRREHPVTIYLTQEEVDAIWNLKLKSSMQRKARDLFIVGIYTVARFSDYSRVSDEIIRDGVIRFVHKKTSTPVLVPVAPRVREVLDRNGGRVPALSQQKLNDAIKEVCKLAGIDSLVEIRKSKGAAHYAERVPKWSLVHSHTARKTGATLMRLNGASMREIMLVGGWSDERTLELYLRMTGEENAKVVATNPFFR